MENLLKHCVHLHEFSMERLDSLALNYEEKGRLEVPSPHLRFTNLQSLRLVCSELAVKHILSICDFPALVRLHLDVRFPRGTQREPGTPPSEMSTVVLDALEHLEWHGPARTRGSILANIQMKNIRTITYGGMDRGLDPPATTEGPTTKLRMDAQRLVVYAEGSFMISRILQGLDVSRVTDLTFTRSNDFSPAIVEELYEGEEGEEVDFVFTFSCVTNVEIHHFMKNEAEVILNQLDLPSVTDVRYHMPYHPRHQRSRRTQRVSVSTAKFQARESENLHL